MSTLSKGEKGEKFAAKWLVEKGYVVQEMNYRYKRGEIDIIARLDELLVFVEVKARQSVSFGYPEEAVDSKKRNLIIETADHYIHSTNWNGMIRFDIISIENLNTHPQIQHFEDAFY